MSSSEWTQKGATLSDKSAFKEYGLTEEEIIQAINDGKLQYRQNHMHGNPYLRLLRHELEALVQEKYGTNHLEQMNLDNELKKLTKEIRTLKSKIKSLEKRKAALLEKRV